MPPLDYSEVFHTVPMGGSVSKSAPRHLIEKYFPRFISNSTFNFDSYAQRRSSDRPAQTIEKTYKDVCPIHPYKDRHWSIGELKRIASFSDEYQLIGKFEDCWSRVGNSVPPLLMYAIARHIRSEVLMNAPPQRQQRDRRPYKQVLDDLWGAHLAPRESDAPTVVSLFAGAGGSSLGYSAAGFHELLAVEWDAHACRCLRQNFPGLTVYEGDVGKLSVERALELAGVAPGELDVLDGSPPCQSFSTAGKRDMNDPRGQLFREYVRMLGVFRPRVFVMENVSGMVKGKMKLIFAEILRALRGAGYVVGAWLLNAMHYGVPQSRERMIFIGARSDLVGAGPGVPSGDKVLVTSREAIDGVEHGVCAPMSSVLRTKRWSETPIGGAHHERFSLKRISRDRPANTIGRESGSGGIMHWSEPREMSEGELKRLGSWPDQYRMIGQWRDILGRIGNSVPPLLMYRIASHVREAILVKLETPTPF